MTRMEKFAFCPVCKDFHDCRFPSNCISSKLKFEEIREIAEKTRERFRSAREHLKELGIDPPPLAPQPPPPRDPPPRQEEAPQKKTKLKRI